MKQIRLNKDNKWVIEVLVDGKVIHRVAIPPKDKGERIDFIDRRWFYSYGHTGVVSHGILVIIRDGKPTLQYIQEHTNTRLRYIL